MVVASAGRPEPLQDALISQLEGVCADTQHAGDVVWWGVLQKHGDDRPILILHLIEQRVDRTRLEVRELLLPGGSAPDDSGLLFGICITPDDPIGAGNGRGRGQVADPRNQRRSARGAGR